MVTGTAVAEAEATDGEEEEEAIVMLPRVMAPAATVQVAAATVAAGGVSVPNLPVTGANSFSLCLSPYVSRLSLTFWCLKRSVCLECLLVSMCMCGRS